MPTIVALSVHLCGASLYWNCLRTHMVQHSWNATCEEMGERLPLTPIEAKFVCLLAPIIGQLTWDFFSEASIVQGAEDQNKPLLKVMYSFNTGQNKKTIQYNQTLVEDLKEGSAFAFKECDQGQDRYLCLQVATDPGTEFGGFEDKAASILLISEHPTD
ncbi:hypothetical protein B0H10DRAFT_1939255 [Mycena sp. CBHHK59/15]|nr:hypothetical protein B0H10DRAFT_1939255 [Mycena sp. CBHHK59/15]